MLSREFDRKNRSAATKRIRQDDAFLEEPEVSRALRKRLVEGEAKS